MVQVTSTGEPLSWWQCATLALQAAVEQGALPELPEMARQKLDEVPFFRELRPRHTAMDNTHLTTELGIPMPTAAEAIATVTRRFLANAECRSQNAE